MRFPSRTGSTLANRRSRSSIPPAQVIRRATYNIEALEERRMLAATVTNLNLTIAGLPVTTVNAGQNISYTIAVRNTGTDFAGGVTLSDILPTGTNFVGAIQTGGPAFNLTNPTGGNGQTFTATLGQLNSNVGATFRITVQVDPSTASGTIISDTATIAANPALTTDTDPTDNSGTVNTTVNTQADVQVTKVGPATVIAGTDVTYTLSITNVGPSDAENVVLTDIVPAMTSFLSAAQQTGPTFTVTSIPPIGQAGTYTATIPTLAPTETATFTYVVHLASSAPKDAMLFNTMRGDTTTFDPALSNNFSTAVSLIDTKADLLIVSDSDKANQVFEGTFFPYTLTVYNLGPSDAQNVAFDFTTPNFPDARPPQFGVYESQTALAQLISGPAFAVADIPDPPASGDILGAITTLPVGVGSTYRITVGTAKFGDLVQNSAVASDTADPVASNNTHVDHLHVYDAPLIVQTAPNVQANAGQAASVEVMTFTDTNNWPGNAETYALLNSPPGRYTEMRDFAGTVDWGDGTTPSTAIISTDGDGTYKVTAYHIYQTNGLYPVHVLVTSDGDATAISDAVAIVGSPSRGVTGVSGVIFDKGQTETKKIATFFPGNAPNGTTFTGTVNWGDGTSSAATLASNGSGGYNVSGTHKYTSAGGFNASVTIHGSDGVNNTVTPIAVTVNDVAILAAAVNVFAQAGVSKVGALLATFSDPAGSGAAGSYSALINWGDGTAATNGVVAYIAATDSYTVKGTHTWATAGNYAMTVTIVHGISTVVVSPAATVTNAAPHVAVNASAVNVSASVNIAKSGVPVATFTDPGGADVPGNYSAVINWGDGSLTTNGVISLAGGVFTVKGTHTWTSAGSFTMSVTIIHSNSPATVVAPVATVTGGSSIATVTPTTITGIAGTLTNNILVGSFTSVNSTALATDFTASINWGDGSPASAGAIVKTSTGHFQVRAAHAFRVNGSYPVIVSVVPNGSAATTITSTANISVAALRGISVLFTATKNTAFTAKTIASFADNNAFDLDPSLYTVTVSWGDGTATTGATIVYNTTTKHFDIKGSHKYTKASPAGGFKPAITVKHNTSQVRIISTATVK